MDPLLAMVMEARRTRRKNTGTNIEDPGVGGNLATNMDDEYTNVPDEDPEEDFDLDDEPLEEEDPPDPDEDQEDTGEENPEETNPEEPPAPEGEEDNPPPDDGMDTDAPPDPGATDAATNPPADTAGTDPAMPPLDDTGTDTPPVEGDNPPDANSGENPAPADDVGAGNDPNADATGGDNLEDMDADFGGEDNPEDGKEPNADADQGADMGDVNATSDMSENGEDPQKITEIDKKNNKTMLRNNYVELYNTISSFISSIDNSDKESIIASVTYNQVKRNLLNLRQFVMRYLMMYYEDNEADINLYNFNYIIQILEINLEMIRKMKSTEKEINCVK